MVSSKAFGDRLADAVSEKKSVVCVGLDPRWNSLPAEMTESVDPSNRESVADVTRQYCEHVLDATKDFSPVVKPQAAFFEQLGPSGMVALHRVVQHARKLGLIVLLDGKRGDIGSTAEGYADAYLGEKSPWQCDALTVNPYLGDDTLEPFFKTSVERNAGIFVLVKTSNPGGGFLQDIPCDNGTLYERVAAHVQSLAKERAGDCGLGPVGAVVGATYPAQLESLRAKMPNAWFLIPGFGAQGGTAADVKGGFHANGLGAVVNSSRGIIFAYQKTETTDWRSAVADAARDMRDQLEAARG